MAVNLGEGYVPLYLTGMSNFRSGLSAAHRQLSMTVQRMDAIGRQARYGLMIAAGATAGALRIAGGFDQGMARVQALTGATGGTFDALREQAMVLGRTTVFTGRQAADAMGYFALAGFDAQKIMQAMPATLNLAAAGQIDVAESADIAAKIMAGMGLEATELTHVMDVLTKAFTTSNTDLRMLGDAFKYVGPVGRSAGKSVEELAATIMAMSNAGIQGQMAGVALRSILVRLTAQPAEVRKALDMLGVSIEDDSGRMKHLAEIVDEVRTAIAGYTPVQQQAIMAMLAGTRAVAAFSVLMQEGGDAIRNFEDGLQNSAGTMDRIAKTQIDTLFGAFKLLWSAVEGLAIAFGTRLEPTVRSLTERITAFVSSVTDSDEEMDRLVSSGENLVRILATIVGMAAVLKGIAVAFGAIAAVGAPWAIGLTALAAAVAAIGVAAAESAATGRPFVDVLAEYANKIGLVSDAKLAEIEATNAAKTAEEALNQVRRNAVTEEERLRQAIEDRKLAQEKPSRPSVPVEAGGAAAIAKQIHGRVGGGAVPVVMERLLGDLQQAELAVLEARKAGVAAAEGVAEAEKAAEASKTEWRRTSTGRIIPPGTVKTEEQRMLERQIGAESAANARTRVAEARYEGLLRRVNQLAALMLMGAGPVPGGVEERHAINQQFFKRMAEQQRKRMEGFAHGFGSMATFEALEQQAMQDPKHWETIKAIADGIRPAAAEERQRDVAFTDAMSLWKQTQQKISEGDTEQKQLGKLTEIKDGQDKQTEAITNVADRIADQIRNSIGLA